MTKFHINAKGEAAACSATVNACPLGGEHYDSMQEAAVAAMAGTLGVTQRPVPDTVRTLLKEFNIAEADLSAATSWRSIPREWHREVWAGLSPFALRCLARNASHWKRYHQDDDLPKVPIVAHSS